MNLFKIIFCLSFLFLCSCKPVVKEITDPVTEPLVDVAKMATDTADKIAKETRESLERSIDKATTSIDTNSADWQTTLKQLQDDVNRNAKDRIDQISKEGQAAIDKADKSAEERIKQAAKEAQVTIDKASKEAKDLTDQVAREANLLMGRGIAQTGTEIRCNADFIGKRMNQRLKELKEKLLFKKGDVTLNPAFCQVVPDVLDLRVAPNSRPANIQFFGYDFFDDQLQSNKNTPLIKVSLRNKSGGQSEDMSHLMALTTHYLLTFKIAELRVESLCDLSVSKDRQIVIETLNGTQLGELNVVCPLPPTPTPTPVPTKIPTATPTPIPPPDLYIVDWQISNRGPYQNDQVSVRALIRNGGVGATGNFKISLYYASGRPPQVRELAGLAGNSETWVDFAPISYGDLGVKDVSVFVDEDNRVAESDEGNNKTGVVQITVRPIPPRNLAIVANLVEHFHYDDDSPQSPDTKLCRISINLPNVEYFPTPRSRQWSNDCSADDGFTRVSLTFTAQPDGNVRAQGTLFVNCDGGLGQIPIDFLITPNTQTTPAYRVEDGKGGYAAVRFFDIRVIR